MALQSCPQLSQYGQAFTLQQQPVIDCGLPWEGELPQSSQLPEAEAVPEGVDSYGFSSHCTPSSWDNELSRKRDLSGTSQYLPHQAKQLDLGKKDLKPCQKHYCIPRFAWLVPLLHLDFCTNVILLELSLTNQSKMVCLYCVPFSHSAYLCYFNIHVFTY